MNRIEVWADVGGTFTDCFVVTNDSRRACKVLSTGVVRFEVRQWIDPTTAIVDVPDEFRIEQFWNDATVRTMGTTEPSSQSAAARVLAYDAATHVMKLSEPIAGQAPPRLELSTGLEAPVLAARMLLKRPPGEPLPPLDVRLGTTRGTNALLTRTGARTALLTTRGFRDVLLIGEQDRPHLFSLDVTKPEPLTRRVVEVSGRLDASGQEIEPLDVESLERDLKILRQEGIESLAICLLHAYTSPQHELVVERVAKEFGFEEISRSSEVCPLIKLVSRCETTVLDAYLNPILRRYVKRLWDQFGGETTCRLKMMTSGGHLVAPDLFRGRDSILSGPAGGIVSLEHIANVSGTARLIGLDMGGTSTDVSRYEGSLARRYESRVADVRVLTPMMDIQTVAAGGGSICCVRSGRLVVGPESAGAEPGPACYGRGGPLTVTDVNLLLGRIDVERFPFRLDREAALSRLRVLQRELREATGKELSDSELAEGFLQIAVTHMAEAVRTVSTAQGTDARTMSLVGFGGAAGQHLCRVAESLEMRSVLDPIDASLLSALGMGLANQGHIAMQGVYRPISNETSHEIEGASQAVRELAMETLRQESADAEIETRDEVDVRYVGTEASLQLSLHPLETLVERFHERHVETFGYQRSNRTVEIVAVRCDAQVKRREAIPQRDTDHEPRPQRTSKLWYQSQWIETQVIDRASLSPGDSIEAPALVASDFGVLVIEPGWHATVLADLTIRADLRNASNADTSINRSASTTDDPACDDPVLLEIIARRLQGVADACGEVLRRTSTSVNVKERRDYSCAIFRRDGSLVANAPHVPVHLGAMGHTVRFLMQRFPHMRSGDCYISNDPFNGGSHLPDVTVVTPVFFSAESEHPDFFVASRAHHAEIGGRTPGSMPPDASCLAEEGVLIRAFALVQQGVSHEEELERLLSEADYPSRNVAENLADVSAQQAAGLQGVRLLKQLGEQYSLTILDTVMAQLLDLASDQVRRWVSTLSPEPKRFQDALDDGTQVAVTIRPRDGRLIVDFTGTAGVHRHGFNATPAIVTAATLYVLRCLSGSQLPLNDGVMRDVELVLPTGLLNPPAHEDPRQCAAVVAGNVETSQRVVDVLLGALGVAAASQGTMNNFLMGDSTFGYYETIGGGCGATATGHGASAVHSHMTNTRITDPEVLEVRCPVRLLEFSVRTGSGGAGIHRGGDGMIRHFEFLRPLVVSLITNRRRTAPYGSGGGLSGQSGRNRWISAGTNTELDPATTVHVKQGDQMIIETPGGGGWGEPS